MSIQANINQALSLAGMLMAMNPKTKIRVEQEKAAAHSATAAKARKTAETKLESTKEQLHETDKKLQNTPVGPVRNLREAIKADIESNIKPQETAVEEAYKAEAASLEKLYKLNPTEENLDKLLQTRGAVEFNENMKKFKAQEAANKAQEALQAAQEEKRKGKWVKPESSGNEVFDAYLEAQRARTPNLTFEVWKEEK